MATAAARGVAPAHLLAEAGIDPRSLIADDARVATEPGLRLWQAAARLTGDPGFGLAVGASVHADPFVSLGLALHGCATLGDSLRLLARYFAVLHQHARLWLDDDAVVTLEPCEPIEAERLRHPSESLFALLCKIARRVTGVDVVPLGVELRHGAAIDDARYLDAYRVVPRFDRPVTALRLPRAALALPNLGPDRALVALAERQLQRRLDDLPAAETTLAAVRRLIREELQLGEPTLGRLAARLHMSERTLQRRLSAEATSVQELIDDARREVSLRALAESRRTIAEIAFALGFAEVRAFHRAFKRWTGSTPAAYRQLHGAA